jgi:hypothetical protein
LSVAVQERDAVVNPSERRGLYAFQELLRSDLGVIYALCDPITLEFRYVGQTLVPLAERLRGHVKDAIAAAEGKKNRDNYNYRWIRSVLRNGNEPIIQILDLVDPADINRAEIEWIKTLRALGCRLTNATDGGEGAKGLILSPEQKAKMSESAKRRWSSPESEADRAAIVARRLGTKTSDAVRQKMSEKRKGEGNARAMLTFDNVGEMRSRAAKDERICDLAKEFGVSRSAASYAITGKSWSDHPVMPVPTRQHTKILPSQADEIRRLGAEGRNRREIAEMFGISSSHVSGIITGSQRRSDLDNRERN